MANIDELDIKIIEQLQMDGDATNRHIAKQVGTSEATVRRRRARLRDEDITRVVTAINPDVLGYKVLVMMGIRVRTGMLKNVEEALSDRPEVRFLGVTFGRFDLVLEAWFKSSEDLLDFINEPAPGTKGIESTETFQVVRLTKYSYDWRPPAASEAILLTDPE